MIKPENHFLFIGGAPRSGTTYLFDWLAQHSKIHAARGRESYFFMDADHPLRNPACNIHQDSLKAYVNHFFSDASKDSYLLDGTDHLLYQTQMLHHIAALPNKKIIFIFREPAQRIFSSFQYSTNNLAYFKKDLPFDLYVRCLLENDHDLLHASLHNSQRNAYVLQRELEYSYYHRYLERWIEIVGRENIYVLQLESFTKDTESSIRKLYDWLELPPEAVTNPSLHRNQSIAVRYPKLHYWSRQLAGLLPTSAWKNAMKRVYFFFQQEKMKTGQPDTQAALQTLKAHFADSNARMAAITELDLTLW